MNPTPSLLTDTVANVIDKDLPHRRSGYPSTWKLSDIASHLVYEAKELLEAVEDLEQDVKEDFEYNTAARTLKIHRHVHEELADSLAIIEHFRQRLGLSETYLDILAAEKVERRFHEMFASSFPPKEDQDVQKDA